MANNRQHRRASAAQSRGTVSATLLQKRVKELELESFQMRNVLFAIIREQGRVRVAKATIEELREGDKLGARDMGDHYIFEFEQSNMVAPQGVQNGKAG